MHVPRVGGNRGVKGASRVVDYIRRNRVGREQVA